MMTGEKGSWQMAGGRGLFSQAEQGGFTASDAGHDSWVLSLSDLMTLMLIFFLIWTTFEVKGNQGAGRLSHSRPPSSQARDIDDKQPVRQPAFRLKGLVEGLAPVEAGRDYITVILPDRHTFKEQGSGRQTSLSRRGLTTLSRLASGLQGETGFELLITGHMDRQPISAGKDSGPGRKSNIDASLERASAVLAALASFGLDPRIMRLQALGAIEPVEAAEKDIRPENNRIEIQVRWTGRHDAGGRGR